MRKCFAETSNFERLTYGLEILEQRGAAEAGYLLVTSAPGYGKTESLLWLASQKKNYIYLRALPYWSPWWFLSDFMDACKGMTEWRTGNMFRSAVSFLRKNPDVVLIIDECEHVLENKKLLETVRSLSDVTKNTVILAGMDKIQRAIDRYPQLSSRIAAVVNFQPVGIDDIKNVTKTLLDGVVLADCLVKEICSLIKGQMRLLLNALARCEAEAKRQGHTVLTLEHMAGQELTQDWRAKRPVLASRARGVRVGVA